MKHQNTLYKDQIDPDLALCIVHAIKRWVLVGEDSVATGAGWKVGALVICVWSPNTDTLHK